MRIIISNICFACHLLCPLHFPSVVPFFPCLSFGGSTFPGWNSWRNKPRMEIFTIFQKTTNEKIDACNAPDCALTETCTDTHKYKLREYHVFSWHLEDESRSRGRIKEWDGLGRSAGCVKMDVCLWQPRENGNDHVFAWVFPFQRATRTRMCVCVFLGKAELSILGQPFHLVKRCNQCQIVKRRYAEEQRLGQAAGRRREETRREDAFSISLSTPGLNYCDLTTSATIPCFVILQVFSHALHSVFLYVTCVDIHVHASFHWGQLKRKVNHPLCNDA